VRTVGLGLLEIAETDRAAVVLVGPDRRFTFAWTVGLSPEDCAQIAEHLSNAPQRDDLIVQTALSGVQLAAWPALYEGRALAFLVALRGTRRGWSEEEREALRTLARQAGLALRNARLMEETARRARQQEALHRLSTVLARADTVREVCEATVRAAQDILGYRAIGVFLLDPATGDRVLQAGHGWPDLFTGHRIPPGQGLSDRAVRTGRTSYCPDVRLDPAYIPGAPDARSELDVPIRMDGSVAGVLVVEQDRVDGFAPEEIATLEATANLVGVALERARLLEEARGRAEHFAALLEFGAALRTTRSPEEMYPIVVRRAMSLVRADRAALALLEPGRRMPTLVALRGSRLDRPVLPADAVAVIRDTPQPVLLPQWPSASGRGERGPTALVPIRAERDVLGILMVGRRGVQAPEFTDREMGLLRGIAEVAGNAIRRAQLLTQLEQAYMDLVLALARAMDARDTYTANHSERIAVWAERTARALGCSEAEIRQIRWAALLHDIGKVGVPDRILRKPGPLTAEEWVEIRRHPVVGEEILRPIAALREVARIVRHHQERWDGMGYPDGLRGEEIPLGARIIAVVDTYGAITDHRPYRPARTHAEAVEELRRCAGTQLDPRIVEVFLGVLEADSDLQPVGA
jgi:putative nucleotidyltransferase with HDIG domain